MTISTTALRRSVLRWTTVPLLGVLVGLGATGAVSLVAPSYRATGSVLIVPRQGGTTLEAPSTEQATAVNLGPAVARLAESRDVALAVADRLQLPAAAVSGAVDARTNLGSSIVTLQAVADSAGGAVRLVDAIAAVTAQQYASLGLAGRSGVTIRVLDTGRVVGAIAAPAYALPLGAVVGALLGLGVVLLRRRFDDRFRDVGAVERAVGLPVLGRARSLPLRHNAARAYERGPVQRAIDPVVAALGVHTGGRRRTTVLVTAAGPDTPTAMVAALLTHGLALGGRTAVVVDAHARSAGVDQVVGSRFASTVAEVLDPANDESAARLISSAALIDHLGALDATRVAELLQPISERADVVVVAAPPVLAGEAFATLAGAVDAVLLVLDAHDVPTADGARVGALVGASGPGFAGVLLLGAAIERDGHDPAVWRSLESTAAAEVSGAEVGVEVPDVVAEEEPVEVGGGAGRHAASTLLTPSWIERSTDGGSVPALPRRQRAGV